METQGEEKLLYDALVSAEDVNVVMVNFEELRNRSRSRKIIAPSSPTIQSNTNYSSWDRFPPNSTAISKSGSLKLMSPATLETNNIPSVVDSLVNTPARVEEYPTVSCNREINIQIVGTSNVHHPIKRNGLPLDSIAVGQKEERQEEAEKYINKHHDKLREVCNDEFENRNHKSQGVDRKGVTITAMSPLSSSPPRNSGNNLTHSSSSTSSTNSISSSSSNSDSDVKGRRKKKKYLGMEVEEVTKRIAQSTTPENTIHPYDTEVKKRPKSIRNVAAGHINRSPLIGQKALLLQGNKTYKKVIILRRPVATPAANIASVDTIPDVSLNTGNIRKSSIVKDNGAGKQSTKYQINRSASRRAGWGLLPPLLDEPIRLPVEDVSSQHTQLTNWNKWVQYDAIDGVPYIPATPIVQPGSSPVRVPSSKVINPTEFKQMLLASATKARNDGMQHNQTPITNHWNQQSIGITPRRNSPINSAITRKDDGVESLMDAKDTCCSSAHSTHYSYPTRPTSILRRPSLFSDSARYNTPSVNTLEEYPNLSRISPTRMRLMSPSQSYDITGGVTSPHRIKESATKDILKSSVSVSPINTMRHATSPTPQKVVKSFESNLAVPIFLSRGRGSTMWKEVSHELHRNVGRVGRQRSPENSSNGEGGRFSSGKFPVRSNNDTRASDNVVFPTTTTTITNTTVKFSNNSRGAAADEKQRYGQNDRKSLYIVTGNSQERPTSYYESATGADGQYRSSGHVSSSSAPLSQEVYSNKSRRLISPEIGSGTEAGSFLVSGARRRGLRAQYL
eukprot:Tbor_TRINITY_DN4283_c0_g1::TRINITY_DN4283_c0_g1_i1::g.23865::m.23865